MIDEVIKNIKGKEIDIWFIDPKTIGYLMGMFNKIQVNSVYKEGTEFKNNILVINNSTKIFYKDLFFAEISQCVEFVNEFGDPIIEISFSDENESWDFR